MWHTLVDLFLHGAMWSLLAVGGMNATLADIQRYAVDTRHWVTGEQFVTFFSLTQAAPGPSGMAVALIGFQAAGLAGALTSTVAKILPSSLMAYYVSAWVERRQDSRIVTAVRQGLAPITISLLVSAAYVFVRETDVNLSRALCTIVCAALAYRSRLNPIYLVTASALLGLTGVFG